MRRLMLLLFLCAGLLAGALAQPKGGTAVTVDSRELAGAPIALPAVLYPAAGSPKGSVVLVHGSSGWADTREGHYGRAFSAAGYTVLAFDAFGPRRISSTAEDQSRLTITQMVVDALMTTPASSRVRTSPTISRGPAARSRSRSTPDSTHGFDGDPANIRMFRVPSVENYIDCVVTIEPDGQQSYGGKKWPPADPAIYAELRRTCVKKGATIWTNLSQKAQATKDVIEFLNLNLAR